MSERTHIADQLKQIITSPIDQWDLAPEDYFALISAIEELQKNCSNCKFSSEIDYHGVMTTVCEKALQPLPEDYWGHFVELNLEVSQDHFCGFHESMDKNKESKPF